MYKPENFWNWFLKHQSRYLTLGEIKPELRDAAVDEMQFELNKFCDQIFFEIGGEEGACELAPGFGGGGGRRKNSLSFSIVFFLQHYPIPFFRLLYSSTFIPNSFFRS